MLLVSSVDTPIHINRFHLLALRMCVQCGLSLKGVVDKDRFSSQWQRDQRNGKVAHFLCWIGGS